MAVTVQRMDAGEFVVVRVVVGLPPPEAKTRRESCPSGPLDESCPVRRRDAAAPHGLRDGLRQQQPLTRLRALTFLSRWEFRSAASQFQTRMPSPISFKRIARDDERSLLKPFQTPAVASLCRERSVNGHRLPWRRSRS
jgi:hypothetical protein